MTLHEKKIAYYGCMGALCVIFAFLFFKNTIGTNEVVLAKNWEYDKMTVYVHSEEDVGAKFIGPNGESVEAKCYLSSPYSTYTFNTEGQPKGKWIMKYPARCRNFNFKVYAP